MSYHGIWLISACVCMFIAVSGKVICTYIHNHTHKYLGVAKSDRDRARTLRLLLGQFEPRVILILAVGYLWLTYSTFTQCLLTNVHLLYI